MLIPDVPELRIKFLLSFIRLGFPEMADRDL